MGDTNNAAEYIAILKLLKFLVYKGISKTTPILMQGDR